MFREILARTQSGLRKRWLKLNLRNTERADAHLRLDLAYRIHDPWNLKSDREQYRFVETNRIVHREFIAPAQKVNSILEIGCGEGYQSAHLATLCEHLTGIDVSPTAVARAQKRLPGADFVSGDLLAQPWSAERGRFDIVCAFEMLYFVKDLPGMLDLMSALGKACIISYFAPEAPGVERSLERLPIAGRGSIRFGEYEWRVVWWRNPQRPG